jgi:ElaB/YqjD/DUF883 family membrane-anchored ribosome-binding protein
MRQSDDTSNELSGELKTILESLENFSDKDLESVRDQADSILERRKKIAYERTIAELKKKMGI